MSEKGIMVTFEGNLRVKAEYKGLSILTDQPVYAGGDGSAPAPFDLFLASIATCAGYYVLAFCRQRG
ncbi:MAG: OsmC family protein, partial [Candidatus Saccharicenans sp.]